MIRRKRRRLKIFLCRFYGLPILLLLPFFISGCSLSYLLQAAAGQFRILNNSVPVERALEDPTLTLEERDRLLLVSGIKAFGENRLGLKRTDNYETVYLGNEPNPVYTVSAAHKTRFERMTWWFPIVGRMPYLGYFDLNKAKAKKAELERKGLDVVVWPAEAYSTLGWFQDPVHRNLLAKDIAELTETILHEMTHATLYAKGQPAFNETLASLVGKRGALAFLEDTFGPNSPEALGMGAVIRDQRIFSRQVGDLFTRLDSLYNGPLSDQEKLDQREKVFNDFLNRYKEISKSMETDRYSGFGQGGLNNAYILAVALYHRHFNLFESVLETQDGSLRKALIVFQRISEQDGDLILRTREWLD
jgi:predicted aminopeptidase